MLTSSPKFALRQNPNPTRTSRIHKHKSLLRRKLGDSDPALQDAKITNLRLAVRYFNNLEICPGQTLSFWRVLGQPTRARGFSDGMLLSDGRVLAGEGGGLCQLANLLYWMALHSPLTVREHHHHSLDIFPDSGRVLPFGSGASVFYNYLDLQLHNPNTHTISLKIWLDDSFLHGELWSDQNVAVSYRILEEDHRFYRQGETVYRSNRLYRLCHDKRNGQELERVLVTVNNARVLYDINPELLES